MSYFDPAYYEYRELYKAENWVYASFERLNKDSIALRGKFFIADRSEINNFIEKAKPLVSSYIVQNTDGTSHASLRSSENYMLSLSLVLDKTPSKELGLLTSIVDARGKPILKNGNKCRFSLIREAGSAIQFSSPAPTIEKLKFEVHASLATDLKDIWKYPKKPYKNGTFSIKDSLKKWLNFHDIDTCLLEYYNYKTGNQGDPNVERMTIYTSLWELDPILAGADYDSIGIFPIVMHSNSSNTSFFPKSGHFVSLLFIPLISVAGKQYKLGGNKFLTSGKGYPKNWRQMSILHDKGNKNTTTFSLTRF